MKLQKNITLLSWHNFFTDFVFFAPVAIIYFAKVTGSYALGMSIFSIAYVSSAIFEIPTGVISDLVGRKKTIIFGSISSVLCMILYAIGGSYWVLFVGAVIQGLSRAFYSGNNDALLHDTLKEIDKEQEYHVYLGRTSSLFQIALAVATAMGGFMASRSFSLVMWLSVLPQICALYVSTRLIEPSIASKENTNIYFHLKESLLQFRRNYKLRLLTMASVIRFSIGEASFFLRSVFVNSLWPLWAVGISYSLSNIGATFSYYFSGKIIDRFKPYKILNFEIIYNRIINIFALVFPTVLSPALMSTSSLTYGVGSVAVNSLLQKEFTQNQRATMSSLNSLAGSFAFGISSFILGSIADAAGPAKALIIGNIILILPLYFYKQIFRHEKKTCNII